jgi:hypothetical protein
MCDFFFESYELPFGRLIDWKTTPKGCSRSAPWSLKLKRLMKIEGDNNGNESGDAETAQNHTKHDMEMVTGYPESLRVGQDSVKHNSHTTLCYLRGI